MAAGKVTHPFCQQHSPAIHPLHCSAKSECSQETTMGAVGCHPIFTPQQG